MSRDASLSSEIVDGELVIRIGVETLAYAFEEADSNNPFDEKTLRFRRTFRVIDVDAFAKDVWVEIGHEEEDGTTPLHLFLDRMMAEAVEQGSIGVEEADIAVG